ncbi:unnamed protein product [Brassica oleracea var. botrytis]|uniref:peptidylprolyl isomerase n=3 Tax=Brassica TaxID=3705 RepID=A0ABQ7ZF77_BRANA|nr:hypothetical protein HID58_066243 [Brassica napus]CAF1928822.1 unnamed protein product [Brassica napus]CDY63671.1 BnaCnng42430D [Brassica napus]VDD44073.1 unnamed protein product [Brassica oleracea]
MYYNYSLRTCRNVELSRRGYNDNVLFHRIIKFVPLVLILFHDFIVQGGDCTGTGRGWQSIYGYILSLINAG